MVENLEKDNKNESLDSSEKTLSSEAKSQSVWKGYLQEKGRKYGDRAEERLNAMPIKRRKQWFFVVFGLLLALLIFNFVRATRSVKNVESLAEEMFPDTTIDWSDVSDLYIMNLDSLVSADTIIKMKGE